MSYVNRAGRDAIENEMPWSERDVPATLHEMLSRTARTCSDHAAISFQMFATPDGKAETFTWAELLVRVNQAANLFRALGITEGDVVACVLPNCSEMVLAVLGGAVAGIVSPINPLLAPEQIASILRETGARVVVTLGSFPRTDIAQKLAQALAGAPDVHTVLEVDFRRYLDAPKSWLVPLIRPRLRRPAGVAYHNFNRMLARQRTGLDFDDGGRDRVAFHFHTGGTTGMPKLARHTYGGVVYNGWLGGTLLLRAGDNIMCPLPLFHVFACHVILMSAVYGGAHVIFPTPAGYRGEGVIDNFWKLNERWKTNFIISVPTAIAATMQHRVDADVSSVKKLFSGSAPLPLELFRRFEKATGVTIIEGYGLTEATCLVSCNPVEGEKKVGSVGIPFPYTDLRIIRMEAEGPRDMPVGAVGEICVANPGVNLAGVYSEAERNRDLIVDGRFLRTGDLGCIDADGYLWITGRAKDLIIRGGHNIDPAEIEEALLAHEAVAFAGAVGQPDDYSGEVPCAYVELVRDASVTAEELMAHCETTVPERAARPRHIEILEDLPKTAVGKIYKPALRKRAIMRVYDEALMAADLAARVDVVEEDPGRGLVARVRRSGADAGKVAAVLDSFTTHWTWAE
ncbi:acyl-CoA synthetase [Pontibaca methylaminivorans]|uniref:Fatty-acyl-CoA synthase/long-chain acyl-CoA synthetase n=1 Tax=Pontibaca methylaminivorans TaxID=515897 RepID=A0A1R3WPR6_9RHOB|nr:acyl-CoA synthetase [Pontibaca methylaminivorans]SIT78623.1 fatty-acyl-CoA synthase/long-chain acyl-CoA synthetase [Pontibaca methylaminivorans]